MSLDSSLDIATDYGLDGRDVFLSSETFSPALERTQPHIQWVSGALYPGVKRPMREAEHFFYYY
jgi:hypothetical protein